MTITADDLDNLRHMLGCEPERARKSWGFRNCFVAGESDVPSMERLAAAGFVVKGRLVNQDQSYHATREGCRAAGMTQREIERMDVR